MQDQKLMDYFKFEDADLEANRKGEFSEAQKKKLSRGLFPPRYIFRKVEGPIKVWTQNLSYKNSSVWYFFTVEGKDFRANPDILNAVVQGDVYAVYYCYESGGTDDQSYYNKILSAEFISKGAKENR